MKFFVRAVITGFGFSVGKALYDKVSERFLGESEKKSRDDEPDPIVTNDAEPIGDPT